MGSMEPVGRTPPQRTRKVVPMRMGTVALEKELIENGDLSKNRKKKILKKLQKKMYKQYEQRQKRLEVEQSVDLKSWMERNGIFEPTLYGELSSFSLSTKDDVQELTQDDIERVLLKVRGVRLSKLKGPEQGQRANVDEDLAKVESWLKAIRSR